MRRKIPVRVGGKNFNITPDQLYALRQDLAKGTGDPHANEWCFCLCHEGQMVHVTPCCQTCPDCGKRIMMDFVERHTARHQEAAAE